MAESDQPAGVAVDRKVRHRVPKGVVAVLVSADGCELANAADFDTSTPGGFLQREAQELRARRSLALAAIEALASPRLAQAIDGIAAEQIVRRMCDQHGCKVVMVPVGHEA